MLTLTCKGSPFEIGFTHGFTAKEQIERCISFYQKMFWSKCQQSWTVVLETAKSFEDHIKETWPRYHEEMRGIAEGSRRSILDIIALNVRTEIAFGQFSDGCTSLSWKTEARSLLGQNWDWETEQKENLILITIESDGLPTLKMMTEAGIIGKIGLNSAGVGVCLNAIRAKGCDPSRMPVHIGLRAVLESASVDSAVAMLKEYGMAASGHYLIADEEKSVGLEFTSTTFAEISMNSEGRVCHTNHLIEDHPGVIEPGWLPDSRPRISRMEELIDRRHENGLKQPGVAEFARLFEDEDGFPSSICRAEEGISDCETLFNICMDLRSRTALVKLGRPCSPEQILELEI